MNLETPLETLAERASPNVPLYRLRQVDLGWKAAGATDFAALDARIQALVTADPDACFLLTVCVDAPVWWRQANPRECVAYILPPAASSDVPVLQSWASAHWMTEAGEALARLVAHVGRAEWGKRCFGFQLEAGDEGEWRYPDTERLPDVGSRMTARFQAFALEKYRRNAGLLRKAWTDPRADFEAITCPNAEERRKTNQGVLRSPVWSRRVLDYYECYCDVHNTAALHFCAVVKRASGGSVLVGLPQGFRWDRKLSPEEGNWFPEPMLDSADVDFFVTRPVGSGLPLPALPESLALHGKSLFVSLPTDLSQEAKSPFTLRRPVGLTTASAAALSSIQWDIPSPSAPRKQAPMAVFLDGAGIFYTAHASAPEGWITQGLLSAQLHELERMGTPFDLYLLSDLFHPKLPDYKILFFLNAFYLSEAERRRVDAKVKRSGQTAVWLWAPGVIGEDGIRAEWGQRLCGQKLRLENQETNLRVRIVTTDDPLIGGFQVGATFGENRPIAPTVTISDKAAVRLGANTANKTVFAVQRFAHWTSVVYGAFPIPAALLRTLLRVAGEKL
jgi:hypothetical protein